jgi:hypothetical protein
MNQLFAQTPLTPESPASARSQTLVSASDGHDVKLGYGSGMTPELNQLLDMPPQVLAG